MLDRACRFEVQHLEQRLMLAFSPAIGGQPTGLDDTPYQLSLLPTPAPGHDPVTGWQIDWGDGTINNVNPHTYTNSGNFAIKARAVFSSGATSAWAPFGLDPGFDADGRTTASYDDASQPEGPETGRAMVIQPDGKILVAGQANGGDFGVARFNADGSLDDGTETEATPNDSFGSNGFANIDIDNNSTDYAFAIALQADGKIVLGGVSDGSWALARFNVDGTLDDGETEPGSRLHDRFGTNGRVITPFGPSSDAAVYGLAVQPDGKIVAVGNSPGVSYYRFTATRYWPSGELDKGFGTNGKAYLDFKRGTEDALSRAHDVAIQPDGRIVLGGYACYANEPRHVDFAIGRLLSNGQPDPAFGTSGKVVTDFGSSSSTPGAELAYSIVLQPDGKIVAGGHADFAKFALARYNTNGNLDGTFGTGGKVTFDLTSNYDAIYDLTLQCDGKLVAAGTAGQFPIDIGGDFAVARLTTSGALDSTWGSGGTFTVDVNGTSDAAYGVAVLPDGDIVAGGYAGNKFGIARFQPYNTVDVHGHVQPGNGYFQNFATAVGPEWQYSLDAERISPRPSSGDQQQYLGWFRENDFVAQQSQDPDQDQDISATLSLSSLPTHSRLTLSFDLYLRKTWDGSAEWDDEVGPDHWMVSADGVNLLDTTFTGTGSINANQKQSYSKSRHDGVFLPGTGAQADENQPVPADAVWYHITLTFAHSRSAVQLRFASNTTTSSSAWNDDEEWALDNLRVSVPSGPPLSEPVDPDLRIDSNNDGVNVTTPSPTDPLPDYAEWHDDNRQEWDWRAEGMRIPLNTAHADDDGDDDGDGIPDFADGYNRDNNTSTADDLVSSENDFKKMVLDLSRIVNRAAAKVRFLYSASNPAAVTYSGGMYTAAPGRLRIWRQPGHVARSINNHYIEPGKVYTAQSLGLTSAIGTVELWIEAIGGSGTSPYFSDEPIRVELDPTGAGVCFNASDQVLVTARNLSSPPPDSVDSLQASPVSSNQVDLTWMKPAGALGYRIYRSKTYGFTPGGSDVIIPITNPNQTTFQDVGLDPSTRYYYRIEAVNADGESNPSFLDDNQLTQAVTAPIPPGNPTAERLASSTRLTWENRSGSKRVLVERSRFSNFNGAVGFNPGDFATTWVDNDSLASGDYFYRVFVIDEFGTRSGPSDTVSVTVPSPALQVPTAIVSRSVPSRYSKTFRRMTTVGRETAALWAEVAPSHVSPIIAISLGQGFR